MILKVDVDGVGKDDDTAFQAFVTTRQFAPHQGGELTLSAVRESWVVLRRGTDTTTTITIFVFGDFGKQYGSSDVSSAAQALETLVIAKWDHPDTADMQFIQLGIGDAAPIDNYWALHHVSSIAIQEGEA